VKIVTLKKIGAGETARRSEKGRHGRKRPNVQAQGREPAQQAKRPSGAQC